MKSPILFIIFKRVNTTQRVFSRIREARPPKLYIAADGPRLNRPDEMEKCELTRKVVENIDWPCEVHRLYRNANLGCGVGVSSAITWFFEHEEQGVIIEDDILPHLDFFKYCDEMLERYKDDYRIQLIAGWNRLYNGYGTDASYYMSNYMHIWGWASWRRVWKSYVFDAAQLPYELFRENINKRALYPEEYLEDFEMMKNHEIDTWDYQLYYNQILYGRYSIIPYTNMIENIGMGGTDATHTTVDDIKISGHKSASPYPLHHPSALYVDTHADYLNRINGISVKTPEQQIEQFKRINKIKSLVYIFYSKLRSYITWK